MDLEIWNLNLKEVVLGVGVYMMKMQYKMCEILKG